MHKSSLTTLSTVLVQFVISISEYLLVEDPVSDVKDMLTRRYAWKWANPEVALAIQNIDRRKREIRARSGRDERKAKRKAAITGSEPYNVFGCRLEELDFREPAREGFLGELPPVQDTFDETT